MVTVISSPREAFVETVQFRFSPRYLVQNVARLLAAIDSRGTSNYNQLVQYRPSVCSVGVNVTTEEKYIAGWVPVFRQKAAAAEVTSDEKQDLMAWR